jgi:ketosteroid isomerase-like protein
MSQPNAEQDERPIRALIDAWCEASAAGDLAL